MIEAENVKDDHPDLKNGPAGTSIPVRRGRTRRLVMRAVGDECVASTRYRVLAHCDALKEAGFATDVQLQTAPRWKFGRIPARFAELVADTWGSFPADILFIHRRTYPPFFAQRQRRPGVPLVFDFDDALYLPPPSASQDERTRALFRRNFLATVAAADLVLCGNRELASQVPNGHTAILPTPVDCELFRPDSVTPATDPVVGWVGHADNLPFLEALADPLRELARRHSNFRLVVVSDRPPKIDGVPVEFRTWKLENEVRCFDGIRVGLMPLDDTPWTQAKCAFKALQYMALGIPPVVSPVGMNREIVVDGNNGFVAAHPEEWVRSIDTLLSDDAMANRLAGAARKTVESEFSLTVTSRRLVAMLEELRA
jgi:glycosyltransferase involved in cell wall biosynthesis